MFLTILSDGLLLGAVGVIAALANVLGDECCELDRLYHAGDHAAAALLQQRLIAPNVAVSLHDDK